MISHLAIALPLAASLFLITTLARAQESVRLDDIEVVGNKEGRTLEETPESVTILPSTRLNRGDQSNSLEVLNGQANVQVTRNAENFSIRGVSNAGVTGYQKDNLASLFVDDVFQTDLSLRAGAFEQWDIQSLEIHRGPQSTSQGVNSLAGAILLQHHAATRDDEAAVKLGYGSFNRREIGAMANQAFYNKKFAYRLSFNKDLNDGFIKNKTTSNDKWGRQDKGHLEADLSYFFDDGAELRLRNRFLRTDNGGAYTIGGRRDPRDYDVYEDQDYRSVTNSNQYSLQYLRPLVAHWKNKTTFALTQGLQHNKSDADGTPTATAGTRYEFARDQFMSFENVLTYQSANVKNALGVHAHQFRGYNNYDFSILFSGTPVALIQDLDKFRSTYAIFDSLLYKLDSHHSLNLGARYEYVKQEYGTFVNPLTVTGSPTVDAYLNSVRGSYDGTQQKGAFLPKIGYLYQNAHCTWGLTYSQGYRIGGVDINRSQAKAVSYDPEYTNNYEASWKRVNDRWQTQANLFYTHWEDQQVEVRLSNTDTFNSQVENASKSEVYGAELEGVYTMDSGDTLRLGAGHVRTRFLSFVNNGRVYTGNEFPDAARNTAQVAWGHFFSDAISSNLTFRYVGKAYTNAENTLKAPEQMYLDLNLQYSGSNYVWELNAKNLTDQRYVVWKTPVYSNFYQRVNRPLELGTRVTYFF